MGVSTGYLDHVEIVPGLNPAEHAYLTARGVAVGAVSAWLLPGVER